MHSIERQLGERIERSTRRALAERAHGERLTRAVLAAVLGGSSITLIGVLACRYL